MEKEALIYNRHMPIFVTNRLAWHVVSGQAGRVDLCEEFILPPYRPSSNWPPLGRKRERPSAHCTPLFSNNQQLEAKQTINVQKHRKNCECCPVSQLIVM